MTLNMMHLQKKNGMKFTRQLVPTIFMFALLLSGILAYADVGSEAEHGKPLEVILQEIRQKQGLGPEEAIDPRKVSDEDLEELGEAIMSTMHPDPEQHETMDQMMGGEGSKRLSAVHRMIGYRYAEGYSGGMTREAFMSMMGGPFMSFSYGGIIMWLILLAVIGLVVYLVIRSQKTREGTWGFSRETPLEILKKRYANSEISREEYERIRRDLE